MGKRPPLDDPRWIPLKAAIDQRQQQTGSMPLAVTDLEKKMQSGELPWKRIDIATGKAEYGEAAFWSEHESDVMTGFGSVVIFRRSPERPADRPRRWGDFDHYPDQRLDQHVYFVWKPRLDALFGTSTAPLEHADVADAQTPKPGPKPRGDWPTLIAQWLIAVAAEDPKRLQNVDALVTEAQLFLRNRLRWAPSDPKAIRTLIRELLRDLRR